ncbi:MAG: efflux RND transporter periplasmic adaptor subunit [Pyrinomonadaceae bacterium]
MTEENFEREDLEGIDSVEAGSVSDDPLVVNTGDSRRTWIPLAVLAGVLVVAVSGAGFWYLSNRGKAGKPVPTPSGAAKTEHGGKGFPIGDDKFVELSASQMDAAGLKLETVGEAPGGEAMAGSSAGVVESNQFKDTPVMSQVAGVLKNLNVETGDYVRRGQTIAVVSSDELAKAQSDYLSVLSELEEARKRYSRSIELTRVSAEARGEVDRAQRELREADAGLSEALANYERSKRLVAIGAISKREFEMAKASFEKSSAGRDLAESNLNRSRKLLNINSVRKNETDGFITMVSKKQNEAGAARARLLVLGLSESRITALRSPSQISPLLPITAPVSGTVTTREANRGEVVSTNSKIAGITDLSTVWVIAQVFEKDLGKIPVGSGAGITTSAYPGKYFRGNVAYIDPQLDSATRTAKVRIELPNPDGILKIGMYVSVSFSGTGGREGTTPLVPKSAIQFLGDRRVVFLESDVAGKFIVREVDLYDEANGNFPVRSGVSVGDRVVTEGSFLLRAEFLKTEKE